MKAHKDSVLTSEMIEIYMKFGGDIDYYARTSKKEQRFILNDDNFCMISDIFQSLDLINRKVTSDSYKEKIYNKLHAICESELVIQQLENIVKHGKKHY